MKKTLLVTTDFYPSVGGVSTYWRGLGAHMTEDSWVVLAPRLPAEREELVAGYAIYRRPLFNVYLKPQWLPLFWHIWRTVKREHVERSVVRHILPVGTAVWLLSYVIKIPYVVSTHGMDVTFALRSTRKAFLARKILERAEYVLTVSRYTAEKLKQLGCGSEKIVMVQGCPDLTMITSSPELQDTTSILLTVGRLVPRKGHEDVIRALPDVIKKVPDVRYVIIGSGPYRSELERIAHECGVAEYVDFLSGLSNEEIARWYMRCAVFIMPAKDIDGDVEGFGIVYLEANAYGKPVIGGLSGGVSDAVLDGETGLLVNPGDRGEIADAAIRLLKDRDLAERLGRQGKLRVEREYRWELQADTLKTLLR